MATKTTQNARRVGALALALMLLCTVPALAEPETTATPSPTRTPPAQIDEPLDVPLDETTQEFRDELARRQARLDEFMAQLDALDRELAIAAEEYNAAAERLDITRLRLTETETDLAQATEAYEFQVALLNQRVSAIYREGPLGAVEVLLDSKSLSDFVARVKFLNTIGLADAEVADALRSQQVYMEQKANDLEDAEMQAESIEFDLKARQIEVMLRIQERQMMLTQAQEDVLDLLTEEAQRRQAEEARLLRDILAGADEAGIVVDPGSPVETVLAYHGIPYLWGGASPAGFDCSGLMMYVFAQHGVQLPHYSGSQFLMGEKVAPAGLQPGDAVFFGSPIHHVGMYVGGGYFVHAPRTGDYVKLSPLADRNDYAGARRYPWQPRLTPPAGLEAQSAGAVSAE
ncbi:MAG: NlpC/P60 family protein [Coriobacteriia bacterium]|nr:NlpC/P60 family protein [Coriobacteriia bacterium]